jgi:hypothetical protein
VAAASFKDIDPTAGIRYSSFFISVFSLTTKEYHVYKNKRFPDKSRERFLI